LASLIILIKSMAFGNFVMEKCVADHRGLPLAEESFYHIYIYESRQDIGPKTLN